MADYKLTLEEVDNLGMVLWEGFWKLRCMLSETREMVAEMWSPSYWVCDCQYVFRCHVLCVFLVQGPGSGIGYLTKVCLLLYCFPTALLPGQRQLVINCFVPSGTSWWLVTPLVSIASQDWFLGKMLKVINAQGSSLPKQEGTFSRLLTLRLGNLVWILALSLISSGLHNSDPYFQSKHEND